jgi:predicted nucleic acid-binding protein
MSSVFVDTNILIYSEDSSNLAKRDTALQWLGVLWERGLGRLSSQVLNEFYVNVTRKLRPPMPQGIAREEVRRYAVWQTWPIDQLTIESAFAIESRYGLSYWDALVIAAAQHLGCRYVLSEDMGHEQTYGAIQVINPFLADIALLNDLTGQN